VSVITVVVALISSSWWLSSTCCLAGIEDAFSNIGVLQRSGWAAQSWASMIPHGLTGRCSLVKHRQSGGRKQEEERSASIKPARERRVTDHTGEANQDRDGHSCYRKDRARFQAGGLGDS